MMVRVTVVAAAVATLMACDQAKYDIVHVGNKTYRLNKANGETSLVERGSLLPLLTPSEEAKIVVSTPAKVWPVVEIKDRGVKIAARTKYRDGQMLYEVEMTPYLGTVAEQLELAGRPPFKSPSVTLQFSDVDGFKTVENLELQLSGGGAQRNVDEKGEPTGLSWSGAVPASSGVYQASTSLNAGWLFFDVTPPAPAK